MGYSGYAGLEAPIGPLYSHGLGPVILYWPYAKLVGWKLNSILICNSIIMSVAFLIFVISVKPSVVRAMILASMYLFYIPIIEYSVTSMTEIPQYACLIMFLALFLRSSKTGHFFDYLALLTVITLSCFVRITNFVLFIPAAFAISRHRFSRRFVLVLAGLAVLTLSINTVASQFSAPYPAGVMFRLREAGSTEIVLAILYHNTVQNALKFLSPHSGDPMEVIARFIYAGVVVLCVMLTLPRAKPSAGINTAFLMSAIVLILPLIINVVFYDVFAWRDYRHLMPFLWIVLCYLVIRLRITVSWCIPAVCLIGMSTSYLFRPPVTAMYERERYSWLVPEAVSQLSEKVTFRADAVSRQDNTITFLQPVDDRFNFSLEPGIGVQGSYRIDQISSGYILSGKGDTPFKGYELYVFNDAGYVYRRHTSGE